MTGDCVLQSATWIFEHCESRITRHASESYILDINLDRLWAVPRSRVPVTSGSRSIRSHIQETPPRPPVREIVRLLNGIERRVAAPHHQYELRRQQRCRSSDHSSADVRRKALARSAKVRRIHSRQIVSPKTQLRDSEKTCEEDSPFQQCKIVHRRIQKYERNDNQSGT